MALYLILAIAPLALSLITLDPCRGFWVNLSVALGFVGLALMGLKFVLAARFVRAITTFGIDIVLQVHRQMTVIITVCIAVASVFLLLVLIVVTDLTHALMIGYYVREPWEQGLWIGYSAAFVGIGDLVLRRHHRSGRVHHQDRATMDPYGARPEAGPDGLPGWARVNTQLLSEVLPVDRQRLQYFLCGSDAMTDGVEQALGALGALADRIHSEHFAMARTMRRQGTLRFVNAVSLVIGMACVGWAVLVQTIAPDACSHRPPPGARPSTVLSVTLITPGGQRSRVASRRAGRPTVTSCLRNHDPFLRRGSGQSPIG